MRVYVNIGEQSYDERDEIVLLICSAVTTTTTTIPPTTLVVVIYAQASQHQKQHLIYSVWLWGGFCLFLDSILRFELLVTSVFSFFLRLSLRLHGIIIRCLVPASLRPSFSHFSHISVFLFWSCLIENDNGKAQMNWTNSNSVERTGLFERPCELCKKNIQISNIWLVTAHAKC